MYTETVFPILATSLGLVFVVLTAKKWFRKSKCVPGPAGWPILGNMTSLMDPTKFLTNMREFKRNYGPIFQLKLGSYSMVMLTEPHLIKKAFNNFDFSFRPNLYLFEFASLGGHGLVASNGGLWQEQRRFALRHLRDLGMGKSSIETHIQREALDLIESLKKTVGQPVELKRELSIAITNIVWALVAGKRMKRDDPVFLSFMAAIERNMELCTRVGIVSFVPWLRKILPASWLKTDLMEESVEMVFEYFKDIIKEHTTSFNPNDLRDYTDLFLNEQRSRLGDVQSTFTDAQLLVTMGDLFVAGGETTATTIRWAFFLLSYHPEVQRKLQEEIDLIVGRERLPSVDDREMMPYTDAVIHEVQRFADIVPMGVFHGNNVGDVEFEGFVIPKDTVVVAYVGDCHRSEKYWAKPEEFYPEHFLDENGKLLHDLEGFLPFSLGKRRCIGEGLARMELFYFITYFFQTFNFKLDEKNGSKPSLDADPRSAAIRWPQPHKVILELR